MAGINGSGPRPLFRSLAIASSGLTAQRVRIETIARNIANAQTTRTADGTPYRRQVVRLVEATSFESVLGPMIGPETAAAGQVERLPRAVAMNPDLGDIYGGVRVAGIVEDGRSFEPIYDPGHPDADENGYVLMPNVNITVEMTDLMEARRLYEANASVFEAVKSILRQAARL